MKNAIVLMDYTREQLRSLMFRLEHKTGVNHFIRESVLNFASTSMIILNMIKKSIKVEVMGFFYETQNQGIIPSRQAFSQAREKISYTAFKDFFEKSCEIAVNDKEALLYKEKRLFAVDGTSFVVGRLNRLIEFFKEKTTVPEKAMCRISAVVDVMNETIVNAAVSPFCVGERALATEQIEELALVKDAIYLFDRGYWSPDLVSKIIANGQEFLMRIQAENKNAALREGLRIYSFILPGGNEEILVTNIPEEEMANDELALLYAKRWGAETKYLELKSRLQIDRFSGETCNTVLQDIYSTLYISNLTAFICSDADKKIAERTEKKKTNILKKRTDLFVLPHSESVLSISVYLTRKNQARRSNDYAKISAHLSFMSINQSPDLVTTIKLKTPVTFHINPFCDLPFYTILACGR